MKRLIGFVALAVAGFVHAATLTEDSQARARKVLDRAVSAFGGAAAIRGVEGLRLELEGEVWPRLQMTTAAPPFEAGYFRESLLLDLKNRRLRLEQVNRGGGFEGHNTVIIKAGEGMNYDHRARTATPIPPEQTSQQLFVQYYRRLPNLLLQQALERATSLRYLGEQEYERRRHEVVTFVMPDAVQVAMYVDAASGLISKYELIFTDPLRGEQASEIMFSDYATVGKMKVPQQWNWRIAGDMQARYKVKADFNPGGLDKAFDFADTGFRSVPPLPQNQPQSVEKLADGVIVVHNVAGQNYNTMAVEFKDFIVAVEAPGSSDSAEDVIRRIKQELPGKPIRYVALTHHHGDHIGGLRAFIAEGATVITTPGNQALIEAMAAAKLNDRLAASPRKPQFLFVDGERRSITDGAQTLEMVQVGPNPHAREMLVAWLPRQRVVFQGDLFFLPNNDSPIGPPQASTVSFAKALRDRNLAPERIASVHGRTATMAEFLRAIDEPVAKN